MLLKLAKETENKIRWDIILADNTKFELYIFKSRIPEPTPHEIEVTILPSQDKIIFPIFSQKTDPIIQKFEFAEEMTKTIRYNPILNSEDPEVGSPYIPISILENPIPKEIILKIEWIPNKL